MRGETQCIPGNDLCWMSFHRLSIAGIPAHARERAPARCQESVSSSAPEISMRRHHEEITILPALSLLLPFAGLLWLRIKGGRKKGPDR